MTFDESLERALHSAEPVWELRSLALRLFSEGYQKATVLELFEKARQRLRQADREADEDALLDVLDFLTGWCSPHVKLATDPSTGEAYAEPGSMRETQENP